MIETDCVGNSDKETLPICSGRWNMQDSQRELSGEVLFLLDNFIKNRLLHEQRTWKALEKKNIRTNYNKTKILKTLQ